MHIQGTCLAALWLLLLRCMLGDFAQPCNTHRHKLVLWAFQARFDDHLPLLAGLMMFCLLHDPCKTKTCEHTIVCHRAAPGRLKIAEPGKKFQLTQAAPVASISIKLAGASILIDGNIQGVQLQLSEAAVLGAAMLQQAWGRVRPTESESGISEGMHCPLFQHQHQLYLQTAWDEPLLVLNPWLVTI